jgi:hypothetical protein
VVSNLRLTTPTPPAAAADPAAGALADALLGIGRIPRLLERLADLVERAGRTEAAPAVPDELLKQLPELLSRLLQAVENLEPADKRLVYTAEELKKELDVSESLLRRAVLRGELPEPTRVGTKRFFSAAAIRAWLAGEGPARIKRK